MSTDDQLYQERYPDTTIPAAVPLRPPPRTADQAVGYLQQLHQFIQSNQARMSEILRILSYHRATVSTNADDPTDAGGSAATGSTTPASGGTTTMPEAAGSGTMHASVNRDTKVVRLFVDTLDASGNPYWYEVGAVPDVAEPAYSDPTGIPTVDVDDITLDFDDGTREFSISGDFRWLWLGKVNEHTGTSSITIPDITGLHHIWFDKDGVLNTSTTVTDYNLIRDHVYLANIYWDNSRAESVLRGDELHGTMPWESHYLQHTFGAGTLYGNGLTIGGMTVDANGSLDSHAEFTAASGTYLDEDREHFYSGKLLTGDIAVWSKEGFQGTWYESAYDSAPIVLSGGVPQVNTFGGGTWGQSSVPNGDYFLAHIFAVNDWRDERKLISIQGENVYPNRSQARDGALVEINNITTNGLPAKEFIKVATIIYRYRSSWTNSWKCAAVSTEDGDDYISWLGTLAQPGSSPAEHANLTGRDDPNQHPDTSLDLSTAYTGLLSGDSTVKDAMDTLDALMGSQLTIEDTDVDITSTYTGWLGGITGTAQDALETLDGLAGGLYQLNNTWFNFRNAAGTAWLGALGVNSSDEVLLGYPGGLHAGIRSAGFWLDPLYFDADKATADVISAYGKGTSAVALSVDENKNLRVPIGLMLDNNVSLQSETAAGGAFRNLIKMDGSDDIAVGNSTDRLDLFSDGTIDAQDNDIETTGNIIAAEGDVPREQNTKSKALLIGGNTIVQCFVTGTPGIASIQIDYEIFATDSTDAQVESGTTTFVLTRTSGGTQAGTYTQAGVANSCSTGTITVTPVVFTTAAGLLICRYILASTGLTTPTYTGNFRVRGNGARQIVWVGF
jgi:hypothetical protein